MSVYIVTTQHVDHTVILILPNFPNNVDKWLRVLNGHDTTPAYVRKYSCIGFNSYEFTGSEIINRVLSSLTKCQNV